MLNQFMIFCFLHFNGLIDVISLPFMFNSIVDLSVISMLFKSYFIVVSVLFQFYLFPQGSLRPILQAICGVCVFHSDHLHHNHAVFTTRDYLRRNHERIPIECLRGGPDAISVPGNFFRRRSGPSILKAIRVVVGVFFVFFFNLFSCFYDKCESNLCDK